jgi:hypothetical protein
MQQPLNDADVEHFRRSGWLLTSPFTEVQADELRQWVTDIQSWAIDNDAGKWLHYQERTDNGPKLCRTENFTPFHEGMKRVLREGILSDIASQLLGENAVLYKETSWQVVPGMPRTKTHLHTALLTRTSPA